MKQEQEQFIREVIDHFVDMYKFNLSPYWRVYEILFEQSPFLHPEIVADFLGRLNMSANIRLEKVSIVNPDRPQSLGAIIGIQKPLPLFWNSDAFQKTPFVIKINEKVYGVFDYFITTLIHELGHLVLYSTYNKYRDSEVAVDLFVMAFGLSEQMVKIATTWEDGERNGYITKEEVMYAHRLIVQKRLEIARG